MKKIFQILYTIWALFIFHVFMIILFPFFIIPPLIKKGGYHLSFKAIKLWSLIFSFFNRIIFKIEGKENIKKGENYIFVVNHTSFLDTVAMPQAVGSFKALAKKELKKIPIFGFIIRAVTEVVDRSSPQSRQESTNRLNKVLKEEGSILVFAEGTMNRTDQPLQRFYDGAFRIAIDAQAKIIPIVVLGAGKLMKPGSLLMKPGKVEVKIMPPVSAKGLTNKDIVTLKTTVYRQMEEKVIEYNNKHKRT
ncbi:1-acyl-sn-glycerol-3-phosphate acyltransferase [Marivirga sp. S37H4]|uniref:1-acyl-sn-glycerol-3-phosphate acyltransferase n=1 Tax=Marivirga aurantiaca TaxID=2802615 RepID=A0A935C4Q8_9BACT|nr:lysophospholipid acyltransferase family protein [Marivirga aurantiaca]MBK6263426.1 1-acyl-sn-glycerol-3-phosphate acyltransferase [Marivirga aurantiaca]